MHCHSANLRKKYVFKKRLVIGVVFGEAGDGCLVAPDRVRPLCLSDTSPLKLEFLPVKELQVQNSRDRCYDFLKILSPL
jgi:hypothetical protein